MYPDPFQNRLDFGNGLFISLILAKLWLSETDQVYGFHVFSRERMEGMAWNSTCWCIRLDFGHGLLIFFTLAQLWLRETGRICGFCILRIMHGRNSLKFSMLMYLDYPQNCFGHGLLTFVVSTPWRHAYLSVLWRIRGAAAIRSQCLLINFLICRAVFRLAPSQWETSLQSNAVSHWLGANLEPSMIWDECKWRYIYRVISGIIYGYRVMFMTAFSRYISGLIYNQHNTGNRE